MALSPEFSHCDPRPPFDIGDKGGTEIPGSDGSPASSALCSMELAHRARCSGLICLPACCATMRR